MAPRYASEHVVNPPSQFHSLLGGHLEELIVADDDARVLKDLLTTQRRDRWPQGRSGRLQEMDQSEAAQRVGIRGCTAPSTDRAVR
mmetsp:Transcript_21735/g.67769  ORF Transcript_21735/g.67769 Transcript_21735/m.67769 type:complete len:86 (+) Transcript_21735:367-624(+)